ncbi:four helix bundle protein [Desulfacinum infernum DSM 9756]|uniref:Four helix bundle protein n=1 Tax=Desulfacinum infernum DSM 9756 TaxID=1121391 RepID=A0A1M5GHX3_9BACT|nr:four helix bundle protein [Desulfacinum infernum]SHG03334.1 four helix bundle protein [Desulfacinum infernum DSM 9756]
MKRPFHRPHKELKVWGMAMELCKEIYEVAAMLPETEKYGLASQLRRAAVSVPSNIAEGAARNSTAEFIQFLGVARGSLAELDTQLQLCSRYLGLLSPEHVETALELVERISKMINALRRTLKDKSPRCQ